MLNCDFKSCGFEPHYLPLIYFFKNTKTQKIYDLKKINTSNFKFFLTKFDNQVQLFCNPLTTYYNVFFFKNFYKTDGGKNFIFFLNKKKWHYSFSLIKNGSTVFYFSLGSILKFLNITLKSLRRSKKGFLILLNVFFSIFKKYKKHEPSIFINFFDHKLVFLKKKFNKYFFKNFLFFRVLNTSNFNNFKKSKSIKRRLTKKFIKQS